ncbi:MAG: hypothetical protein A4E72_01090 [Syntrophus sp. PtaU1.Bin208]|nr:MAG: hypothetical protein A4E72_01090 [Syntrophus sp. PtaU1.Bin208]
MKILSLLLGFLFTAPFILSTYSLIPFLGRKKALRIVGRQLTSTAALGLKVLIPRIHSKRDYSIFKEKVKRNFLFVGRLYHLRIEHETGDKIEFRFHFCPVSTMLKIFGLSDLCRYSCAGDWEIAKENKEYWTFSRQTTIGTGGRYCNHTYTRKE